MRSMKIGLHKRIIFLICVLTTLGTVNSMNAETLKNIDITNAVVVATNDVSETEEAGLAMLVEEIGSRSAINLTISSTWPDTSIPVIAVGLISEFDRFRGPYKQDLIVSVTSRSAEGFKILVDGNHRKSPTIFILGNDVRGVLFGIGYFLRKIQIYPKKLLIKNDLNFEGHPKLPIRGHQLGYRPKTNSYDGFDIAMWESYIRDLIVFGTNTIELVSPRSDDTTDGPMLPLSPDEMMVKMNRLLEKYGLNVWLWYPMVHGDYADPKIFKESLKENEEVFKKLSKLDAVFVPGGDPGNTPPKIMFDYLEKESEILRRYHPKAKIWISPQGFNSEWLKQFYQYVKKEPEWLGGVVYGPHIRVSLKELKENIPSKYAIRRYPDIAHNYDAQYPVPNWDYAFAATENRESINPRPLHQTQIFRSVNPDTYQGFVTYSEGINDDVNKMVWSGLGWDPDTRVIDILRDYSRYFIGPDYATDFTQGLLDLENNWNGSLLDNRSVYTTLERFKTMEKEALPKTRFNWRFLSALYRAYYDAYDRSRLIYETHLEERAMDMLRKAPSIGSDLAMKEAMNILHQAALSPISEDWRARLFELGEALFQTIHMQKSVWKYFAKRVGRGANLDLVDYPLNNRIWLEDQFKEINKMGNEKEKLVEIDKIINWTNPGPGGFYDDLGSLNNQLNLGEETGLESNPFSLSATQMGFTIGNDNDVSGFTEEDNAKNWRVSWSRYMQTIYDQPLMMHYSNLDTTAQYAVKMTYSGDNFEVKIRLIADENTEVHDFIDKPFPVEPVLYDIPQKATRDGELTLKWSQEPGQGGNGRGCQIGEVWLIKK